MKTFRNAIVILTLTLIAVFMIDFVFDIMNVANELRELRNDLFYQITGEKYYS